jgi:PPOX class probable F420-dependent enzyme
VLDGRPGDFQFLFTTYAESAKGRGLRRNTQVAASVDDPAPPYSFVIIEGAAQLSGRLEDVRAAATRIGGRYMGEDRAAEFGARNGVPGELLIRLTPARIIAQRAVSG